MSDLTDVTATGDSSLSALLRGVAIQSDLTTRLSASGATLTFTAGMGSYGTPTAPFTIALSGHVRTITAAQNVTASGGMGTRFLVADISGTGPGFVLSLQLVQQTSATQLTLAALWFDGTALALSSAAPVDYGPAFTLSGLAVSAPVFMVTSIAGQPLDTFAANTAYRIPTNMGSTYFTVATQTRVQVSYNAVLSTTCPTPGMSYVSTAAVIGNAFNVFNLGIDFTGATQAYVGLGKTDYAVLPPGFYQFTVQVATAGGATAVFDTCKAYAELSRGT